MDDTRLGALLLEGNLVRGADLDRCLEIQALTRGSRQLGQVLIDQGIITEQDLEQILAMQRRRRSVDTNLVAPGPGGVERFLRAAQENGASELILTEGRPTSIRVGGELRTLGSDALQPPEMWQFLLDYMGPEVLDRLADQQFVSKGLRMDGKLRGRMAAFRHFEGACCTVRLHPTQARSMDEARLPERVRKSVQESRGLVLLTGERRSGVTSTMATLLEEVAQQPDRMVVWLDSEQEYELPASESHVVFRRVGSDTATYATGVAAAVREDADVIFVSDVSCPETFDLALRAAEGGRLVVAALPARDIQTAVTRALNFYPDHDVPRVRRTIASALNCVIRQRLVPTVGGEAEVLATELLVMDEAARAILREAHIERLHLLMNIEDGVAGHTMDACLEELLREGRIELEDAFRSADDKARFLRRARSQDATKETVTIDG